MSVKKELLKKPFTLLLSQHVAESGMKLNAIAFAAGITYVYLNRLLNETRHPSEQVALSLAKALRLSPEQTGEFLAAAGYAPALALLHPPAVPIPQAEVTSTPEDSQAAHLAQRCYRLALEIPEALQGPFLDEMERLFGYARYKYLLCGGVCLTDLRFTDSTYASNFNEPMHAHGIDISSMDAIAIIVGELRNEEREPQSAQDAEAPPQIPTQVEDMLNSIDQLTGSILAGEFSAASHQPRLVEQIREVLRQGVPWEIRRRIAEALPGICRFDAQGACQILEMLRLDEDQKYKVDIRRRVVETLVFLYEADPSTLPRILKLLEPQKGDEIWVPLATIEACGDILTRMKQQHKREVDDTAGTTSLALLLPPEQAEIIKIQRELLVKWEGTELECLKYSLALYDLLCAPDAMLLSVREGLQSPEKLMQLVAARYLERLLPLNSMECLQVYKWVLEQASSRNVRRSVARAMPSFLRCLNEASLPIRTLARTIIITLAKDSDIHIRRTVSDYAMQLFHIDREFLMTLLRHLHQDRDQAIRHRLHPVALQLAELWFVWYAETAGLVHTTRRKTATPFGE